MSANGNREGEADLHARRIIFKFGVHERFEFGETDDFVIHGVHFFGREAEQGAVKIDVFAAGELGVKADAKLDERDERAVDFDVAGFGVINVGEELQKSGFAGAVAADNAEKLTFLDFETEVAEDFLASVAFDAFEPVKDGLFKASGALGGEFEGFTEVRDFDGGRGLARIGLGLFHRILGFLHRFMRVFHRFSTGFRRVAHRFIGVESGFGLAY